MASTTSATQQSNYVSGYLSVSLNLERILKNPIDALVVVNLAKNILQTHSNCSAESRSNITQMRYPALGKTDALGKIDRDTLKDFFSNTRYSTDSSQRRQ